MKSLVRLLEKLFKFFSSIQLAIIIITSLAIVSAIGTIIEARYDATYAQKMVYGSIYMYFILALLCVNLINVIIDRYPWQAHHAGFICAHVGIIVLIIGSLITKIYGIDGSLSVDIGQKNRYVMMTDTELVIYATFGDGSYKSLFNTRQDFLVSPPKKKPIEVMLGQSQLKITDYYQYSTREQKVVASESEQDGPSLRIQLQNDNINLTQWLSRSEGTPFEVFDLGPARIVMAKSKTDYTYSGGNEVVFVPESESKIHYQIFTKSKGGLSASGVLGVADLVETGWMGIQLRILKYLPRAKNEISYIQRERPTGLTTSAVKIEFDGKEYWLGLNSSTRLFTDDSMYLVAYRNQRIDLGFDIHLDKFTVGRYQGTNRAMSYESLVSTPGLGSFLISMNEPLKHSGFTFYQASFQENEKGEATTSILSVNRDPGRFIKYLGSLFIVLGTIIMFYFKRYRLKIFGKA